MNSDKKIIKISQINKLTWLYQTKFETKNYYISYKLFKLKKTKIKKKTTVEYLKTTRYVIPLPSEEEPIKLKKTNDNLPFSNFNRLYEFFDNFLVNQWLFFYSSLRTIYDPSRLSDIDKFDHNLRFEIYRALRNVYCLLSEDSFFTNYSKMYFSPKKFKFFSLVYFRDMFKKYWNPNLPLTRRRGESMPAKVEGTALLGVREIIFWELVFEELGLKYKFSNNDLKTFYKANIDPNDPWYYWPTWRFHILGFASHDGRIFSNPNQRFFKDFSELPGYEITSRINFSNKKKILAQYLYWRDVLLLMVWENWLFFDISSYYLMNFNSKIIYLNKLDHSISFWHKIVNNYIQYKLKKSSNETIFDFPIPDFYYGYNDEFLRQDFFNIDVLDTSLLEDERLWLLIDNWINLFLRKLSLTNEFEKIYNLKSIKENINYFVYTDLKKVKIWLIKRWNKKNNIYSTLSRFNKPDYLEITPQNILSNLKKKDFVCKIGKIFIQPYSLTLWVDNKYL